MGKRRRYFTHSVCNSFGGTLLGFKLDIYRRDMRLFQLALTLAGRRFWLTFWRKGWPYP